VRKNSEFIVAEPHNVHKAPVLGKNVDAAPSDFILQWFIIFWCFVYGEPTPDQRK
jgi:hypothetical protein